jgi:hypothetical protein
MCNDDIDIEEFVKKNREKIESILKEQKGSFREKFEPQKEKVEDAMKGVLSLFLDPKIQIHFIRAGMEFLHGVEAIVKKAPLPDDIKETMDKASAMKDRIVEDIVNEMDPKAKPKDKEKKMKKIDVE